MNKTLSIFADDECILQGGEDGSFLVTQDLPEYGLFCPLFKVGVVVHSGSFRIIHHSPSLVCLEDHGAIPLYCFTSSHSLDYDYQWEDVNGRIPWSTPVLWVDKAGIYHCTVTQPGTSTSFHGFTVEGTEHIQPRELLCH